MNITYTKKPTINIDDNFYAKALDVIIEDFDPQDYLNEDMTTVNVESMCLCFNDNVPSILDDIYSTNAWHEILERNPKEFYSYDLEELTKGFKNYITNKFK